MYCPYLDATGTCAGKQVPYLDAYGSFLRQVGAPAPLPASGALWIVRVVLLVAVVLHIWSAWQPRALLARPGRPRGYARAPSKHTSYASRTFALGRGDHPRSA